MFKNHLTRHLLLVLAFLLFALALAGCATMFSDKTQTISINSNPSGALVTFNGLQIGTTPVGTLVRKRSDGVLMVQKEGYHPQTITVDTDMTGAFFLNIFWGLYFPLSSTTDVANNSAYEYSPDSFFVQLIPIGESLPPEPEKDTPKKDTPKEESLFQEDSQLKTETFMAEAQLRKFILFNHRQILRDSSLEQGEYLDALSELLSVKTEEQKTDFAAQLLELYEDNPTAPEFAERIIMLSKNRPLRAKTVADFR